MKNTLKKNKTRKAKSKNGNLVSIFVLHCLILTCTLSFTCGCEETLQNKEKGKPAAAAPLLSPSPPPTQMSEPEVKATQIIVDALADNDPQARINAIEVVATTKQVRWMPKVQRLLSDKIMRVRFAALLAVGDSQYSLAERPVKQMLKDRDLNVKIAASYAMVKLGHPEYLQVLQKAITNNDQTVRANAALLLGKSGNKDALKTLHWALKQKDSNDMVRFQAVDSIAMLGDEEIFPKLWAMLISAYADDRVMGIQAMGNLGTPKVKNVLITMLDDEVLEVRLAAAEQLGVLKDTTGEPVVLEVYEKNLTAGMEKVDIQRANIRIALAIGQIGTKSLTKFLPQLLDDESKSVRIAAAKAVFQCAMKK